MKVKTLSLITICFYLVIAPYVEAQPQKGQSASQRKPGTPQPPNKQPVNQTTRQTNPKQTGNPLHRLLGAWSTTFSILAGGLEFGTGGVTIKQVDSDTVSFSLSRSEMRQRQYVPGGPVIPEFITITNDFTLKRSPTPKLYWLTVQSRYGVSFEQFPLTYAEGMGFKGEGTVTVGARAVLIKANIAFNKGGGHSWSITALGADTRNTEDKQIKLASYDISFFRGHTASSSEPALADGKAADIKREAVSPILLAAKEGDAAKVTALLAKGMNANTTDADANTPLMFAAEKGDVKTTQVLLAKRGNENAKSSAGETALMKAAKAGHSAVVEALLANGADVNAKNKDGETALLVAAHQGHTEIAQMLLDKGAEVDAKDKDGNTALVEVAYKGGAAIAQALLDRGADANAKGIFGRPALAAAAWKGHTEIVRALLNKGADPNARDDSSDTALLMAVQDGHIEVVRLLLEKGADVNAVGYYHLSVIEIAKVHNRAEIIQLLRKAGAKE